jgi:hypothetical protein
MPKFMEFFIYPHTRVILSKVGLREEEYKSFVIFGHMILALFMALNLRAHVILRRKQGEVDENAPLIEEKEVYETSSDGDTEDDYTIEQEQQKQTNPNEEGDEELDNIQDPEPPQIDYMVAFKKAMRRAWKKTKEVAINLTTFTVNFLVRYSYNLSLIVLYFADLFLPNADILHAIYCKSLLVKLTVIVLFFLIYFVFPSFARKTWIVLVLYCQFVIVALYFFNVYYDDVVGIEYTTIGLIAFQKRSFWLGLVWHIVVLFVVSIEYHVQNMNRAQIGNLRIDIGKSNY